MIDLSLDRSTTSPKVAQARAPPIPPSLTFEDIQKMHYSNLNNGGIDSDEFRPQDFLDMDSGDSDNEILAKFKPQGSEKPKMISLNQPQSPIKHFAPTYIASHNSNNNIEEQTGYSNSPKFSIYRLNN